MVEVTAVAPVMLTVPAPTLLKPKAPIRLGRVKVPASEPMDESLARVTAVPQALSPLMLRRAPLLEIPEPWRVRASAAVVMPPWISSAAPEVTLVPAVVPPRALALRMFNTPAVTEVAPV